MNNHTYKRLWLSGIVFFILAGLTGVFFRVGMLGGDTLGLSLQNIRHAHSHLMFFGWAAFIPFIIAMQTSNSLATSNTITWQKSALLGLIIVSPITFLFFLLWGYHPVAINDAQLPLAAIFSSFVMIAWYVFAIAYWKQTTVNSNQYTQWFSVALFMLIVSSLGAWGVGVLQFFELNNILLPKAMTQFFLGTFTEGWVVLIILGMIAKSLNLQSADFHIPPGTIRAMIALGAPLTFAYGIHYTMLTPELLWTARIGGVISSIALLVFVFGAAKKRSSISKIWFWPIALLGGKAFVQLFISIFPDEIWFSDHNLRILYLHILLLGSFTIGSFAWIHEHYNTSGLAFNLILYACLAVLFTLLLPTNLLPIAFKGLWVFYALAVTALIPVIAAMYQFYQIRTKQVS